MDQADFVLIYNPALLFLQAGETALSLAADSGHEDCVLALLEADCDPNITTVQYTNKPHSKHKPMTKHKP